MMVYRGYSGLIDNKIPVTVQLLEWITNRVQQNGRITSVAPCSLHRDNYNATSTKWSLSNSLCKAR